MRMSEPTDHHGEEATFSSVSEIHATMIAKFASQAAHRKYTPSHPIPRNSSPDTTVRLTSKGYAPITAAGKLKLAKYSNTLTATAPYVVRRTTSSLDM